eukprot:TRINITY_DN2651_c0_g1_i1.p1 TRINITY_DN2651_c0_g1~~TRINITY_DN2651_c0_g1_i1.p1  ORF type:complete len:514 (+),score=196.09 TRINITY_DN2651_c0_g1_i1:242-1783(+)
MINRGLKTAVDLKFLNARVTVDKELFNGERYVYRVKKDNTFYILKGYQILLEHLKPGDEESRQRFISVLSAIAEAYQEYFFSKIACLFNQHFAKPLEIDQEVELTSDVNSLSYLYIEILFEYAGEPLNSMGNVGVDCVYNLMRQSANALSLLHNTGLMHLDIKPTNMMFNAETNLLKMVDAGTSFGYGTHSIICKRTKTSQCIRESSREFAPPEIIRERDGFDMPIARLLAGNVDVYCWAMCFYTMLLQKSVATLIHEANFYKLKSQEEYDKFMSAAKLAMGGVKTKSSMEQKKKEFILQQMYEALSFNPQERPSICEIQKRMKEFEKKEKIVISYDKLAKDYEWKMMQMLMIGDERKARESMIENSRRSENRESNSKRDQKQVLSELNLKIESHYVPREQEASLKAYSSMIEKEIKPRQSLMQEISNKRRSNLNREIQNELKEELSLKGRKNLNIDVGDYRHESMIDAKTSRGDKNLQSSYFSNKVLDGSSKANCNSMIKVDSYAANLGNFH